MNKFEIKELFTRHNYIMKTSDLNDNGVTKNKIMEYLNLGYIQRCKKGYYIYNENKLSDLELLNMLLPNCVISLESGLFYYGYTTAKPDTWNIAVERDISRSKLKFLNPEKKITYLSKNLITEGVITVEIGNVAIKIFDRDRLIVECIYFESKLSKSDYKSALSNYIIDENKSSDKLLEYSKLRNVEHKVMNILGNWI